MTLPPAIFLMGPTASGKTDLALWLARQLPCEIISVDSALVYRGLDIGSAKPDASELATCPHHLIDILDPAEPYSAACFRHDALQLMQEITARGRLPLLVGGTMMYFRVLLYGMSEVPNASTDIRRQILDEAGQFGWHHLHQQLQLVDPVSAGRIHPNDPQRLQRALEVYRSTGISMTEWRQREQQQQQAFPYRVRQVALAPAPRSVLHQRIAQRFEHMLQQGFEQEVRSLFARPDLHADLPAIRAVGYRQMWAYLAGEYDYATMRDKGIAATRQLAKRQLTWLRGWQDLLWLSPADAAGQHPDSRERLRNEFLRLVNQHINRHL